jgi:hypothetical protein
MARKKNNSYLCATYRTEAGNWPSNFLDALIPLQARNGGVYSRVTFVMDVQPASGDKSGSGTPFFCASN